MFRRLVFAAAGLFSHTAGPDADGAGDVNGRARPGVDLGGLLRRCEINYRRLMRLLPQQEAGVCRRLIVGKGENGPFAWQLDVLETTPYTSRIRLAQQSGWSWMPDLVLEVRAYHDAALAEVIACQGHRHFRAVYDYPNAAMHQPDEKVALNRFLGDWLQMCQRHGREAGITSPVA